MAADVSHGVGDGGSTAAPGPDPARKGWTVGRIVALVAGSILVLACVALLGGAMPAKGDRPAGHFYAR
jgi:hypothetical protein